LKQQGATEQHVTSHFTNTGHFGNDLFQTIHCIGTNNEAQNNEKYTTTTRIPLADGN